MITNPFSLPNPPKTVQELFADASRWTQGQGPNNGARNEQGQFVDWSSATACCFCLGAAIGMVYRDRNDADQAILTAINKVRKVIGGDRVSAWNDMPGRTIDEVREVARLAGI